MLASARAFADPAAEVNRYRAAAGLPEVKVDARLSAGCAKHADYLRRNFGSPAIAGLAAHREQAELPGATRDGADCGKNADLFVGVADLDKAVDGFMAGIYHRRPVLDPGLAVIGIGTAKLPDGNFVLAIRLSAGTGGASAWPVAYPADHQHDVPREYGNEIPNPVPGGGAAGYPITLQFPPFDRVTNVRASLVDARGRALAIHLSDPEHPATSFPQSGVVSVIPRQRLAPATTYTVAIDATWKGKRGSWKWSFTTLALHQLDAGDRAAIRAALGVPSLVRGTVTHAGTIAGATFLQLGKGEPMLSVIVPTAVWKQVGGAPSAYEGKTVEVDATPQLVDGKYLNLPIATRQQLRLVR
ncbi:MAG: CAP domain-containing protein [Acidobacteriota bacterium]